MHFFIFLFIDDSEDGGNFTLQAHGMCAWIYKHVHLGMPYSKVGTDGINPSIPVLELMDYFTTQYNLYMSNGQVTLNLANWQEMPNRAEFKRLCHAEFSAFALSRFCVGRCCFHSFELSLCSTF